MRFNFKYLVALIGIVAMSLMSCAHDDIVGPESGSGESVTISFLLKTEQSDGADTRAISDGTTVDMLCYAIFTEDGEVVIPKVAKRNYNGLTSVEGKKMNLTLPSGRKYKAVFWAQNSQTEAYTLTDDMTVSVNYALACNDEKRDAFYAVSDVFATSDDKVEVILRRPFAQLNAGTHTFDWEYVKGFHNFNVTKSLVRVRDVAHSINLFTGELSDYGSASFKPGAIPTEMLKAEIGRASV